MNDPAVAAFWELEGPQDVAAAHLRPQLDATGAAHPVSAYWPASP